MMGSWVEDRWRWSLRWRRVPFEWESELIFQVNLLLSNVQVHKDYSDSWLWLESTWSTYSSNSAYQARFAEEDAHELSSTLAEVWKLKIPLLKWLFAFGGWCGIGYQPKTICQEETSLWRRWICCARYVFNNVRHLITSFNLFCEVATKIWNACYQWISQDFAIIFSNSVVGHFWVHSDFGRTSAEINILKVVWSAVIFRIRKQERNQCIYTQHVADWKTMVHDIIFLVW